MLNENEEEVRLFLLLCSEQDQEKIKHKLLTYIDYCRLVCISNILKLLVPVIYLSECYPEYSERYSLECDTREKIAKEFDYIDYPAYVYYQDEIWPQYDQWFKDYYNKLNDKQKSIVDCLMNKPF